MRTRVIVAFLIMFTSVVCSGQNPAEKTNIAERMAALSSDDLTERTEAYYRLRSDKTALQDEKVRAALLDLLDRENRTRAPLRSDVEAEGYAEYKAALAETVDATADWKNERQVCILAHTAYNPNSVFAARLASVGPLIVPCLMEMVQSKITAERYKALPVLLQLRAANTTLVPETKASIVAAAARGLRDSDEIVRIGTVAALAKYGNADMIPALKTVTETDPVPDSHGHSMRKRALEAIAQIQKRAAQQ